MGHNVFDPNGPWVGIITGGIFLIAALTVPLSLLWQRFLPVRVVVPEGNFGVVTLEPRLARSRRIEDVVEAGQPGVQPGLLPSGSYKIRLRHQTIKVRECLVIDEGDLGVVILHDAKETSLGSLHNTAGYEPEFGDFSDLAAVLAAGGQPGVQVAVLPPGEYALHPGAFEVVVITPSDEDNWLYGRETRTTSLLLGFDPYTAETERGTAIVIRPHAEDDSLALSVIGIGIRSSFPDYQAHEYVIRVTDNIVISWEVLVAVGVPDARREIFAELRRRTHAEIDGRTCGATDLAARIVALEKGEGYETAWVTEAVMLPSMYARPDNASHRAMSAAA